MLPINRACVPLKHFSLKGFKHEQTSLLVKDECNKMRILLLAVHKAKIVERVPVQQSRRHCTHCGSRKATIKLALPNLREGARIYKFLWYCEPCYKKDYAENLKRNPNASDVPMTREEIMKKIRDGTFFKD